MMRRLIVAGVWERTIEQHWPKPGLSIIPQEWIPVVYQQLGAGCFRFTINVNQMVLLHFSLSKHEGAVALGAYRTTLGSSGGPQGL